MADIDSREPIIFAAGDSLYFRRWIPEYPASEGWSLSYELFTETGGVVASFNSTAQGDAHLIEIDNFAAQLDPKQEYLLAGYAVNPAGAGGGAERHQIYRGGFILTPNFGSGANVPDQTCEEEKFVRQLREGLHRLYSNELVETDVNRVRMLRVQRKELRLELNFWEERLAYRRKQEAVRNGRPNPNIVAPFFNICP